MKNTNTQLSSSTQRSVPVFLNLPFNSLAPGKFEWNFRYVIFKRILVIDGWGISCEISLIWMSLDFTNDQTTLVQAMAWCRQATSHYLNQCWPRPPLPYGVTRSEWVNPWSPRLVYMRNTNSVITVPADVLAPSSACTVLTLKPAMFSFTFGWLLWFLAIFPH